MRKLALAVLMVSGVAGFVGCSSSPHKVTTGTAGHGGSGGGTGGGTAGGTAGAAGDMGMGTAGAGGMAGGTAGTGGAAGGTAGAGGMAGAAGTGGAAGDGTAGTAPPATCDNMTKKALPYDVLHDFTNGVLLNGAATATAFQFVTNPNCDQTSFPAFPYVDGGSPPPPDGGGTDDSGTTDSGSSDSGSDAGVADSGSDAGSSSDSGASDHPADAPADAPQGDGGGTDAAAASSCIEFSYDPDQCIANAGGNANNCWDGVIFAPQGTTIGANAAGGICIGDGAKHITFEARASRTVMVKFGGGGNGGDGSGSTEFLKTVTTTWQTFSIDGPTNVPTYNMASSTAGVWDGFSVVGIPDQMSGVYIFVRNVRWTQ
jgi:hypothetical protein